MCREPSLRDLTLERVRAYVAYVPDRHVRFGDHPFAPARRRLSDHTINLHGRVLRAFANWLFTEGCLPVHALAHFKRLKPERREIVPLSVDEFRALVNARAGPARLQARGLALRIMRFDPGLRVSEIANIRIDEIDLDAGVVRVRAKASRRQRVKWRTVGMGPKCLA